MTCVMPWKHIQYNMQLAGIYILILDVITDPVYCQILSYFKANINSRYKFFVGIAISHIQMWIVYVHHGEQLCLVPMHINTCDKQTR